MIRMHAILSQIHIEDFQSCRLENFIGQIIIGRLRHISLLRKGKKVCTLIDAAKVQKNILLKLL